MCDLHNYGEEERERNFLFEGERTEAFAHTEMEKKAEALPSNDGVSSEPFWRLFAALDLPTQFLR